jgi:hypothetical protein
VEEAVCDRTKVPATAKPPRTAVDGAHTTATTGGEFSEGMNKRLTFALSGLPEAGPLEGRVGQAVLGRFEGERDCVPRTDDST